MADDELWHVRMSPEEVKQLTLEQLDDLFRLDIIEADTLIWQPGMTEWLPLSVVAGLGDEDPEPVNIPVSLPPPKTPPMARTQTAWPPAPRAAPPSKAPAPPSVRAAPPPLSQRPAPPSLSSRPAPPLSSRPAPPPLSQRPAPPSRSAPPSTATSWPPPSAWSNAPARPAPVSPYASTLAEPQAAAPRSVAPVSYAPDPFAAASAAAFTTSPAIRVPRARSMGGSWVILLSVAAGAAVTLYRNDLVHAAMRSIGQEGSYVKLESALGGPSFGTPRAVQQMAAAAALVSTPATDAPTTAVATSTGVAPAPSTASPASDPAPAAPASEAKPSAPSEPSKPAQAARAPEPPKSVAAPRPTPHATSSDTQVDPVFKTPKKGKKAGKGNEYDPLNPSL